MAEETYRLMRDLEQLTGDETGENYNNDDGLNLPDGIGLEANVSPVLNTEEGNTASMDTQEDGNEVEVCENQNWMLAAPGIENIVDVPELTNPMSSNQILATFGSPDLHRSCDGNILELGQPGFSLTLSNQEISSNLPAQFMEGDQDDDLNETPDTDLLEPGGTPAGILEPSAPAAFYEDRNAELADYQSDPPDLLAYQSDPPDLLAYQSDPSMLSSEAPVAPIADQQPQEQQNVRPVPPMWPQYNSPSNGQNIQFNVNYGSPNYDEDAAHGDHNMASDFSAIGHSAGRDDVMFLGSYPEASSRSGRRKMRRVRANSGVNRGEWRPRRAGAGRKRGPPKGRGGRKSYADRFAELEQSMYSLINAAWGRGGSGSAVGGFRGGNGRGGGNGRRGGNSRGGGIGRGEINLPDVASSFAVGGFGCGNGRGGGNGRREMNLPVAVGGFGGGNGRGGGIGHGDGNGQVGEMHLRGVGRGLRRFGQGGLGRGEVNQRGIGAGHGRINHRGGVGLGESGSGVINQRGGSRGGDIQQVGEVINPRGGNRGGSSLEGVGEVIIQRGGNGGGNQQGGNREIKQESATYSHDSMQIKQESHDSPDTDDSMQIKQEAHDSSGIDSDVQSSLQSEASVDLIPGISRLMGAASLEAQSAMPPEPSRSRNDSTSGFTDAQRELATVSVRNNIEEPQDFPFSSPYINDGPTFVSILVTSEGFVQNEMEMMVSFFDLRPGTDTLARDSSGKEIFILKSILQENADRVIRAMKKKKFNYAIVNAKIYDMADPYRVYTSIIFTDLVQNSA